MQNRELTVEEINQTQNRFELARLVESYLESIDQKKSGESLEEAAIRLRGQDLDAEADMIAVASQRWQELKRS